MMLPCTFWTSVHAFQQCHHDGNAWAVGWPALKFTLQTHHTVVRTSSVSKGLHLERYQSVCSDYVATEYACKSHCSTFDGKRTKSEDPWPTSPSHASLGPCWSQHLISMIHLQSNKSESNYLVGGFNPFEEFQSNWVISPCSRGVNKKMLKPPSRLSFERTILGKAPPVMMLCPS